MSLKQDIDYVKEELTSQEQFLSNFMKIERFFKKHKMKLISLAVICILGIFGMIAKNYFHEQNKIASNKAFLAFLNNPSDATALANLKDINEEFYQIATYMIAKKENKEAKIEVKYLKELNEFDTALKNNDIKKIEALSMNEDFLLKEYAIFYRALILAQNGKFAEANKVINLIPKDSNMKELANLLKHYLATKG